MNVRDPREDKWYPWCGNYTRVLDQLRDVRVTRWERTFLNSIAKNGPKRGGLTFKQVRRLGILSKNYLQDNQYEDKNWW